MYGQLRENKTNKQTNSKTGMLKKGGGNAAGGWLRELWKSVMNTIRIREGRRKIDSKSNTCITDMR